jgi:hypothetical protein
VISLKIKTQEKVTPEYKTFLQNLEKIKGSYVAIGIHEGAGEYPDGPSVVEVGFWNEFGTETIPERSFIRSTIDGHEGEINSWRTQLVGQIIDGKITTEKALETLGFRIRELIRNTIKSDVPPPYGTGKGGADANEIARRQEAKRAKGIAPVTLIESGLLLRSIEYKVVLK